MTIGVQESFDRAAVVKVWPTISIPSVNGNLLQVLPAGMSFPSRLDDGSSGYRMRFRIEKIKDSPNACNVWIYNLGPTSRPWFRQFSQMVVMAGYGEKVGTVFVGQILKAVTVKDGPDYVTHIQAGDGTHALRNAHVDVSYKTPTPGAAVVSSLLATLRLSGINVGQVDVSKMGIFNNGIVISGGAFTRLKEICEQNNLSCSIQDGKIYILPFGDAKLGLPVEISSGASFRPGAITENTGLIGIPEIREGGVDITNISFKTLLNYNIGPYQKVNLSSRFINGAFVTLRATHDGDTWEGPWYTEVEASGPGLPEVTQ